MQLAAIEANHANLFLGGPFRDRRLIGRQRLYLGEAPTAPLEGQLHCPSVRCISTHFHLLLQSVKAVVLLFCILHVESESLDPHAISCPEPGEQHIHPSLPSTSRSTILFCSYAILLPILHQDQHFDHTHAQKSTPPNPRPFLACPSIFQSRRRPLPDPCLSVKPVVTQSTL